MEHSLVMAKKMKRLFGDRAKVVNIKMLHEAEVRKYVMGIEEAHKRAAESKLTFP